MEEHDSIDLRSKAFQEVMGVPPNWLLRWGITAIFIAFLSLFVVGYFLEYPETVTAAVKLETSNPPIEIGAPVIGQIIVELPEDTFVSKGTILGRIRTDAGNFDDILELKDALAPFEPESKALPNLATFESSNIGLIKPDLLKYQNIYTGNGISTNDLRSQSQNSFRRTIETINKDIVDLDKRIIQKQAEVDKIPKKINSIKTTYENRNKATKSQNKKDSLSADYYAIIVGLNNNKDNLEAEIRSIKNDIESKRREIDYKTEEKTNLDNSITGTQRTQRQDLEVAFSILKIKLEEWSNKYIIKAPEDGTLVYQGKLKSKEYFVDKGDKIFAIIQQDATDEIEGKLYVSSKESVKITEGKTVKIKFNAYKPSEYGLLNGVVTDKATIPKNGQYLITVALPEGMKTSKLKDIPFEHQMLGEAQIITKNRNFTGLIWDQFVEMLNR